MSLKLVWIDATAAEKLELPSDARSCQDKQKKAANMLNVKHGFLCLVVQNGSKLRVYSNKIKIRQSWKA